MASGTLRELRKVQITRTADENGTVKIDIARSLISIVDVKVSTDGAYEIFYPRIVLWANRTDLYCGASYANKDIVITYLYEA